MCLKKRTYSRFSINISYHNNDYSLLLGLEESIVYLVSGELGFETGSPNPKPPFAGAPLQVGKIRNFLSLCFKESQSMCLFISLSFSGLFLSDKEV